MNRHLAVAAILLIVALPLIGCGDDPASSDSPPRWMITIGGAGDEIARDVARIGYQFVVVGSSDDTDSSWSSAFVAVVDGDGAVLADTVFAELPRSSANAVIPLGPDRFAVGGRVNEKALLMVMDLSLNVDTMFTFEPPDENSALEINSMALSIAGGYIVAGSYHHSEHPIPTYYASWLAYVDEGDTLVNSQLLAGNGISSIEYAFDGTYAFVWNDASQTYYCDPGQPCDISDICVGRCTELADTLWMKSIPGPDAERAGGVYVNAGDLLVAGSDGRNVWVGKVSSDGNAMYGKSIIDSTGDTWANDIDLGPQETHIVCGAILPDDGSFSDAILIKLEHDTSLIWQRQFGGDMQDDAIKVLPLAFGYLVLGQTYSSGAGGADIWLIRTDLDGRIE